MKSRVFENRPETWRAVLLVLALFVGYGYWQYRNVSGDDLASSYVGSRLMSDGLSSHLFHYDPVSFDEIGQDDTWTVVAHQGRFYGFLHPYVQTPLWAYLLQPLCRHLPFWAFSRTFLLLTMLSFAGALWLTAKYWAPSFFNPAAMLLAVLALVLSRPFQYAMYLNQTHMLIVCLTLIALVLAEKDRPISAGVLLAFAASVKITPALLVVYWLLTGRRKAVVSTAVWGLLLWCGTVFAVGHTLTDAYLANLHRISRVLLVSQNNQSFAAWVMARFYPSDEVFDINIFPLPTTIRLLSSAFMLAFTVWGGLLDRRSREQGNSAAPLGAMMAMVAATAFAPIAWTHYAIILLMPLMILADRNLRQRSRWIWALIAMTAALNYRPLATDVVNGLIGPLSIIRGQFFACVLMLAALPAMAYLQRRQIQPVAEVLQEKHALAA